MFAILVALHSSASAQEFTPPAADSTLQLELAAVGLFGPSGRFDPGARLGTEFRPTGPWGFAAGFYAVTGSRALELRDLDELTTTRFAADGAVSFRHDSKGIVSTAALGARAGWVRYGAPLDEALFYSQILASGRGEWSFSDSWFGLFEMELAFAVASAQALINGVLVDDVAGMEADLSLGIGYRF